ncbi:hypothetical protein AMTR_s04518p00003640 [Amborella trichopoda]|uniref:Uncharacterized protein n=1 Tax=Amborella trichopoda TaxID=13333 RepID=U5CTZ6_AMBTC|nr:hypothetical protein AMTR_s04518p00003640 [Amborella trichopoda]
MESWVGLAAIYIYLNDMGGIGWWVARCRIRSSRGKGRGVRLMIVGSEARIPASFSNSTTEQLLVFDLQPLSIYMLAPDYPYHSILGLGCDRQCNYLGLSRALPRSTMATTGVPMRQLTTRMRY